MQAGTIVSLTVSSPSPKAVVTSASCWLAARVARSTQVEGPPSLAAASLVVPQAPPPTLVPPSRLVEPSGAAGAAGDPQHAACAVQKAVANSEASPMGVPGTVAGWFPEVHPQPMTPAKISARKVALPAPQRRFRMCAMNNMPTCAAARDLRRAAPRRDPVDSGNGRRQSAGLTDAQTLCSEHLAAGNHPSETEDQGCTSHDRSSALAGCCRRNPRAADARRCRSDGRADPGARPQHRDRPSGELPDPFDRPAGAARAGRGPPDGPARPDRGA